MTLLGAILGWLARHALLFVLLVAALAFYAQYRQSATTADGLTAAITRIEAAETILRADLTALKTRSVTTLDAGRQSSLAAIDARLAAIDAATAAAAARRPGPLDLFRAPRDAIVAQLRSDFDREILRQERDFLQTLRRNLKNRGTALGLDRQIAAATARIADLDRRIAADSANFAAVRAGPVLDRYARDGIAIVDLATVYADRVAANRRARADTAMLRQRLQATRAALGTVERLATPRIAMQNLEALLAPVTIASAEQTLRLESTLGRQARHWYDRLGIADVITPALWALAAIILAPLAIRTLFYWVLAPLVSLQRPIRLLEPGTPIRVPADRSSVSKAILLAADEELLVKQGFLQTSSQAGAKATQLLLDPGHPLTSLAAGLAFLTRIRGGPTTVSAIHDGFAEIAELDLPPGGACILQPRAIAGVVHPIASPLRITSHWRLGTLNAWLTWQLRFLVFHGPARIILAGRRGVRIEPAMAGRSIGQDQLIGFSAGLAYATGRTETFLPYLFGREPLLKDRIAAGEGLLIAEEAPMAGRARTGIARGLEGATDALLKVFGI